MCFLNTAPLNSDIIVQSTIGNKGSRYLLTDLIYLLIFYLPVISVSVLIPVYIFKKTRILKEVTAIIGMVLFIGLLNLFGFLLSTFGLSIKSSRHSHLSEAYGVLSLIIPMGVYLICWYFDKKRKKA